MDSPTIDIDLGPKKIEDENEEDPLFHCNLCDTEVIHKLAQMFLPGLASACVDNTSGGLFKTPGSVTVDLRKEMIDYLTQRTESFVAESVILDGGPDGEVSNHPFDIISNLVDDFASSKRNFFSRVSAWLLSEKREDKIDDFLQEMDMNGFWTLDRRETFAETLLKNVDFHKSFHCTMSFNSSQELADHVLTCNFRPMICQNQGCNTKFCASHLENHDSICPFKIIPCEQRCSNDLMRRDMDRHCITVCPMKLVNCPFHALGCRSAVAQCMLEKHCLDDFQSHLWHLLKGIYKEASGEDLQRRVEQIMQALPSNQLSKARDIRSLKFIIKDVEAKLGPLEVTVEKKNSAEIITTKDESSDINTNIDNEQGTRVSDMVISSSSDKVNDLLTKQIAENVGKSEDSGHSNIEVESSEEVIKTSNVTKLPDEVEVGLVSEDITQNYNDDVSSSSDKVNDVLTKQIVENVGKSEDSAHSNIEVESNEEMIKTSNVTKLPDEVEVGLVSEDIAQNYNDDVSSSSDKVNDLLTTQIANNDGKSEDSAHSNIEVDSSEEMIKTSNITKLPVEVGLVSEDIAQNYNDDVAGELKFKDNEENTDKNIDKSVEEINTTNEDYIGNTIITNKYIEDDNFEDSGNLQSIQNAKMETTGSAENNVKNKGTGEDDNKDIGENTSKV